MKHAVLYVPGLGDHRSGLQRVAVWLWRLYGVRSEVLVMGWGDSEPFETKLNRLLDRIDTLHASGHRVSLVGASAGATAVINAYALRPGAVHKVVCICGALRGARTDGGIYRGSGAFSVSQGRLYQSVHGMSAGQKHRILSIRPQADNVVAPADTIIEGAQQRVIPSSGHAVSIALCLTVFSYIPVRFIRT